MNRERNNRTVQEKYDNSFPIPQNEILNQKESSIKQFQPYYQEETPDQYLSKVEKFNANQNCKF